MRVANDQEGAADPASEQCRLTDLWAGGRAGASGSGIGARWGRRCGEVRVGVVPVWPVSGVILTVNPVAPRPRTGRTPGHLRAWTSAAFSEQWSDEPGQVQR